MFFKNLGDKGKEVQMKQVLRNAKYMTGILAFVAIVFAAAPAMAQNPHFTSGPTSTVNGATLTECATIAGLGNEVTTVTLTCSDVTFQCQNSGGNIDNAHQTLTNSQSFQPHNGTIKNACVSVTASCPDHQTPINVNFGSCTYTVFQNGQQVLP
jgi:hypothetical protein